MTHPLNSSWRWYGGTGSILSRSSHSSTPRQKTRLAAPCTSSGSRPFFVGRLESLYEVSSGRWWCTSLRGPGVGKVPELPNRFCRENWEAMVLSESSEVLLFELRAIPAGWLGLTLEQGDEIALAMDTWPQAVFRARVRSLEEAGGFLCLD